MGRREVLEERRENLKIEILAEEMTLERLNEMLEEVNGELYELQQEEDNRSYERSV